MRSLLVCISGLLLCSCSVLPTSPTTVYALADQKTLLGAGFQRESIVSLPFPGMEYELNETASALILEKTAAHTGKEQLLILGAADVGLPPEYARTLGQRRAEAVRKLLIEEGWSPERLHPTTVGNDLSPRSAAGYVQIFLLRPQKAQQPALSPQ
jgi:hypothetical protein